MSIRFKLFAGFFTLILIFVINFFINYKLSEEVVKNISYISSSETVIRNSNILQRDIIQMQSGFRGFLLTGRHTFLQPYYDGINRIVPLIDSQRELVTSAEQKKKLDSIKVLHYSWLAYSNELILSRLDTSATGQEKYTVLFETQLKTEVGKRMNDKIQLLFLDFDNHEYDLRHQRRAALQASLKNTRIINFTLMLVSIILALLASFYFIRIITRRIATMVHLAEKISKGNFETVDDHQMDELNKLSVSLNAMSQTLEKNFNELKKKNNELDQFAYVVSHDLKAPLRGISNIISWLEEDHEKDLVPEIKSNLELIKGRTLRLENMINGLLEYARVGRLTPVLEEVDTSQLLNELVEILVPKSFDVLIEGNMPVLYTQKIHIEQVFSNLISNAVKYNDKLHGKIVIKVTEYSQYYEFSVTDNGPGIEPEYFEKIFQVFQTLKERDAFESTGVGLAIVKKILDDYNAEIKVRNEGFGGVTFTFTWPKKQEKK
jgi:signal transduction histidine kinase